MRQEKNSSVRNNSGVSMIETLEDRKMLSVTIALAENNRLLTVDSENPSIIVQRKAVTGLARNDRLVGIDYRPATGELFALGRSSRLYLVDPVSGKAQATGYIFDPKLNTGALHGFDFNPQVDRIRVIDSAGQNLRLNQLTGQVVDFDPNVDGVQPDGSLVYAPDDIAAGGSPDLSGAAYTNNVPGSPGGTTLYAIDVARGTLVTVGSVLGTPDSPNAGSLKTVGSLGVSIDGSAGFDIVTENGVDTAYASLKVAGRGGLTGLYRIDLATGQATLVDRLAGGRVNILGIAMAPKGEEMFGLLPNNVVIKFDSTRPDVELDLIRVRGLMRGERLLAIDTRPATGQLYAIGSRSNMYVIDTASGAASQVGSTFVIPLESTKIGFDFNPTVDRIRLVTSTGQNLRLNPDTGAVVDTNADVDGVQPDGRVLEGTDTPLIPSVAYTGNFAGSTATVLWGIDTELNALVSIGSPDGTTVSPNTGQTFFSKPLPIEVANEDSAFDIVTRAGVDSAYAAFRESGIRGSRLHAVDLMTGETTFLGGIGKNRVIVGLTSSFVGSAV